MSRKNNTFLVNLAAKLVQGGLKQTDARKITGVSKMQLQYYLAIRRIPRPILGTSQSHPPYYKLELARQLLLKGATPLEVMQLTGLALSTIHKHIDIYPIQPKRKGRKPKSKN